MNSQRQHGYCLLSRFAFIALLIAAFMIVPMTGKSTKPHAEQTSDTISLQQASSCVFEDTGILQDTGVQGAALVYRQFNVSNVGHTPKSFLFRVRCESRDLEKGGEFFPYYRSYLMGVYAIPPGSTRTLLVPASWNAVIREAWGAGAAMDKERTKSLVSVTLIAEREDIDPSMQTQDIESYRTLEKWADLSEKYTSIPFDSEKSDLETSVPIERITIAISDVAAPPWIMPISIRIILASGDETTTLRVVLPQCGAVGVSKGSVTFLVPREGNCDRKSSTVTHVMVTKGIEVLYLGSKQLDDSQLLRQLAAEGWSDVR